MSKSKTVTDPDSISRLIAKLPEDKRKLLRLVILANDWSPIMSDGKGKWIFQEETYPGWVTDHAFLTAEICPQWAVMHLSDDQEIIDKVYNCLVE